MELVLNLIKDSTGMSFACFSNMIVIIDGAGGKGTWGKLLDTDGESCIDRNDPNYDSGEVIMNRSYFSLWLFESPFLLYSFYNLAPCFSGALRACWINYFGSFG